MTWVAPNSGRATGRRFDPWDRSGVNQVNDKETPTGERRMSADVIRSIRVDDDLSAYRSFFDDAWAQRNSEVVFGKKFSNAVDSLTFTLRAIAVAHRLPRLLIETLRSFGIGLLADPEPLPRQILEGIQPVVLQRARAARG